MNKLIIWTFIALGGWIGWWLGTKLGFEFFGCFMISSLGSLIGVFVGWKIANDYL